MTTVTISDIGHALVTLDMELDRLCAEEAELQLKLEHTKARMQIIDHAIDRLLHSGKYEVQCAGA